MKKRTIVPSVMSVILTIICVAPFLYILLQSIVVDGTISLRSFYEAFFATPQYLARFWRSLALCLCIAGGAGVYFRPWRLWFCKMQIQREKHDFLSVDVAHDNATASDIGAQLPDAGQTGI